MLRRRTLPLPLVTLALLIASTTPAISQRATAVRRTHAAADAVVGEYMCATTAGKPCATSTPLRLQDGGAWGWGRYNGHYRVADGVVYFRGVGGAATWGPALVSENTLTFSTSYGPSIWQKAVHSAASLDGVYTCRTAPGGCLTHTPIRIEGSEWHWGADGGTYSILDGGKRIRFSGLSSGPGGWGIADIGNGTITWHTNSGDSMWSR